MAIAIIEARREASDNRDRLRQLEERHAALLNRWLDEELRQDVLRAHIHREVLAPFAATFSRVRHVHLADFEDFEMPGVRAMPVIELVSELEATIRSGRTVLGGARGMAVGTAVLGGAAVVPALLVGLGLGTASSRRDLRNDGQKRAELDREAALLVQEEMRVDAVLLRAEHLREVLRRLLEAGLGAVGAVTATIEDLDDVRLWSSADRARVAALVSLVAVTTRLMRAPLTDGSGAVADLDGGALADAHRWLRVFHDGGFR